jgi:hypothetical protein|tara:strand:+ start:384 stop:518 length:135 start_codon:yes stop_codon:yes gene_type:complete
MVDNLNNVPLELPSSHNLIFLKKLQHGGSAIPWQLMRSGEQAQH